MTTTNMRRRLVPLVLLTLLLSGCQSYKEGVRLLCNSVTLSGAKKAAPDKKTLIISKWFTKHIRNTKVKEFFLSMEMMTSDIKVKRLNKLARKAGLKQCHLAHLFQPKKKRSSPKSVSGARK